MVLFLFNVLGFQHITVDADLVIPNYCPTSAKAQLKRNQTWVWFIIKLISNAFLFVWHFLK